jgi:hypothetical protein
VETLDLVFWTLENTRGTLTMMATEKDDSFNRIDSELRQTEDYIVTIEPKAKILDLLIAADEQAFIELTIKIDEHPDGYDGPCLCALCRSYAD